MSRKTLSERAEVEFLTIFAGRLIELKSESYGNRNSHIALFMEVREWK